MGPLSLSRSSVWLCEGPLSSEDSVKVFCTQKTLVNSFVLKRPCKEDLVKVLCPQKTLWRSSIFWRSCGGTLPSKDFVKLFWLHKPLNVFCLPKILGMSSVFGRPYKVPLSSKKHVKILFFWRPCPLCSEDHVKIYFSESLVLVLRKSFEVHLSSEDFVKLFCLPETLWRLSIYNQKTL